MCLEMDLGCIFLWKSVGFQQFEAQGLKPIDFKEICSAIAYVSSWKQVTLILTGLGPN